MFANGMFVARKRVVVERRKLYLRGWPERLNGFKIAVLADFHIGDAISVQAGRRAVALAIDAEPDMVVLPGDFADRLNADVIAKLTSVLEPLLLMEGAVVACPGNHDHPSSNLERIRSVLDGLNIRLLVNESWEHLGVTWVGIDSIRAGRVDIDKAFAHARHEPRVVLWHEPDAVETLPHGAVLQISGHSHGGQFILPGGYTPVTSEMGSRFVKGFFPNLKTPLYVSRGIGTTFLPSRLNCAPEVSVLEIYRLSDHD